MQRTNLARQWRFPPPKDEDGAPSEATFAMPFMISPQEAARRLYRGLQSGRFEVTFPKRFTWLLKVLRILPYALYFPLIGAMTGVKSRRV